MDGHSFEGKKFWIVRVDPGEDVLISVRDFIHQKGIKQGMIVMGYGTLNKSSMHWMKHGGFPAESVRGTREGGIEIMSMNGIIIEGKPHIHFTASAVDDCFGGHLEEGNISYLLCEVGIVELEGARMTREPATIGTNPQGQPIKVSRLTFD